MLEMFWEDEASLESTVSFFGELSLIWDGRSYQDETWNFGSGGEEILAGVCIPSAFKIKGMPIICFSLRGLKEEERIGTTTPT